ncbi:MAG: hypothetical protein RIT14_41 [Pseudomonadota bacterium]|jgi:hypothetical protein
MSPPALPALPDLSALPAALQPPPIAPADIAHLPLSAWHEHAPFAFWLIQALRPGLVAELGVHSGFSYFCFCQAIAHHGTGSRILGVDTWQGDDHAGFYDDQVFADVSAVNAAYPFSTLIRATFAQALAQARPAGIDLLHIDGRHGYADVRADFESWRPALSPRALVLFHDTEVRRADFGVWRFWDEVSQHYPAFNFPHGHGLGVLGLGPDLPDAARALFKAGATPEGAAALRQTYATAGKAVARHFATRQR